MNNSNELLDLVTPLVPSDKVREMVTILKNEDKQYLFRYGSIDEILAFPHTQLKGPVKLQYHLFVKGVYEEALRRERLWTIWEIWKKQPNFRVAIDFWFLSRIIRANDYKAFERYLPFVSPQIVPLVYLAIFSAVTPIVLAEQWTYREWLSFERIFIKPEKDDDEDVRERYQRGQQLFKDAVEVMSSDRYQEFKARIVSPVSLKLGGTDLSLLFRK